MYDRVSLKAHNIPANFRLMSAANCTVFVTKKKERKKKSLLAATASIKLAVRYPSRILPVLSTMAVAAIHSATTKPTRTCQQRR